MLQEDGIRTKGQAENQDFYSQMQYLRGVFRFVAEKSIGIENKALEHWLRVSAWWFLGDNTTLKKNAKLIRFEASESPKSPQQTSQQCYVDLAKA